MVSGQQAQALLLTGIGFGKDDLNRLAARVGSQLALQMPQNASQRIVAASLPAEQLQQLRRLDGDPAAPWLAPGSVRTFDVRLDNQPERLHVLPLQSGSDDVPVSIMAIAPVIADAALTRAISRPTVQPIRSAPLPTTRV